ncbi:MAG TPA: pyruvate dehydrogenase complex dihydrolipoamide acetyltransferase [Chthoniobacteraceae bacterium]|jgi:pyruvate dehydrogenase E2 component (dihydrolipoamide acetyltransferase)|nr:pyruvate dehydrogenase complex dihydrolipoamide acetyltransferase [Chthoniobacteraceae bacterium]
MPAYIEMPKLSDTMTEGTLVKWRKQKGDKVASGDILAEVETDKATMEMESFDDGVLTEIYVPEGQKVAIGQRIAMLLAPGESAPAAGAAAPAPKAKASPAPATGGAHAPAAAPAPAHAPAASSGNGGERAKASPLAKKIAAEKGIQLSTLTGSGPGGRIIQRDVLGAQTGATTPRAGVPAPAPAAVPAAPAGKGDEKIPLSGMRRAIAERLLASKTQIPHFYLSIEVDAGELMRIRSEINADSEKAGLPKLTVNDFILKAAITAAARNPKVNASFAGDSIIQYASINMAVAVAVDDGLVTPVIRDAQKKSLREISETVKDMATRARSKKLKPEEYQGGTLTVSNLGSYGIESFSAIINPPQALILSIGAIVKKPVVNAQNQIVVGQRMSIGLSADHRVVDGAIGAEYLAELRRLIENPALMLI